MTRDRTVTEPRRDARPRRGVIGLGNPFRGDDGVVFELFDRIEPRFEGLDVTFVDVGDGNLRLLHVIGGFDRVLVVDAVRFGGDPGDHVVFDPAEATSRRSHESSHDADLFALLELAEEMGIAPERVLVFGIEPERTEMGAGLSEPVARRLPALCEALADSVKRL